MASPLADARNHAVGITRNGKDLYATNSRADRSQPGDVTKLDAHTGDLVCNTIVGASLRRENKVKELDLSSF